MKKTSYKKDNPLQFERKESADYRIKKLKLRGFRKFPFKERGYYSLDFTLQKEPCSCFFIGSNGSGKTSLFSSLQETCSGAFTAAESRGVQKKTIHATCRKRRFVCRCNSRYMFG